MKYLKLFETGEWASDLDWAYTVNNPDDDCEECSYIRSMEKTLEYIQNEVNIEDEIQFDIEDIRGIDLYQGAYGIVRINDDRWEISYGYVNDETVIFIEDFPIDNSDSNTKAGFIGTEDEVVEAIIDNYKPINKDIRKYNL